eukprot:6560428-Prymnesium_polylepis.2
MRVFVFGLCAPSVHVGRRPSSSSAPCPCPGTAGTDAGAAVGAAGREPFAEGALGRRAAG